VTVLQWIGIGLAAWVLLSVIIAVPLGRFLKRSRIQQEELWKRSASQPPPS
jgi:hypothetical protein